MAFRLSKKVNNAIYGYGAAVVIIGALMKITYFSPSWAPGIANTMLTIGLVIEALIFAYSAIDPSLQKEEVLMSEKIDDMFKNAKLDEAVVKDLAQSIKDFDASAKAGAKSAADLAKINQEFANNANELTKQMAALSSNLETLNGVYGGVLNAMNRK